MNNDQVLEKIQGIARDVIGDDDIQLSFESKPEDIDGWDSLNHVQIVVEVQEQFDVKFSALEMLSWDTVGDMCATVVSKLK